MRSHRHQRIGAAVCVLVLSSAGATAATLPSQEFTVGGSACRVLPVKQTYSVDASGRRTTKTDGSTAKVKVFGSGDSSMSVTVPPKNFDPHTATQAELRRYGFPPRPESGDALTRWNRMYPRHTISYVTPTICSAQNGVRHLPRPTGPAAKPAVASETSPNWSGGLAIQQPGWSGFTFAVVQWTEPTFVAGCSSASGYSIWSGLGGWNVDNRPSWGLLQAGVDNIGGSGPNNNYAFWEALNQNEDQTIPEQVIKNFAVRPGDQMQSVTYYSRSDKTVSFQLYNLTTGKLVTLGPWKTIVDDTGSTRGPTADFYDGSSAELIAERPSVGDTPINLRVPEHHASEFTDTEISDTAEGDPFPGYSYPGWESLTMVGSTTLSEPTRFPYDTSTGSTGWTNTWAACS
jgi:hypothetical protein